MAQVLVAEIGEKSEINKSLHIGILIRYKLSNRNLNLNYAIHL